MTMIRQFCANLVVISGFTGKSTRRFMHRIMSDETMRRAYHIMLRIVLGVAPAYRSTPINY